MIFLTDENAPNQRVVTFDFNKNVQVKLEDLIAVVYEKSIFPNFYLKLKSNEC